MRTPKTHLCLKDLLRLNKSVGMEAWFNSDLIDSYLNMALWSSTISLESNVFFVFDCFFYQRLPQPANFVFNSNILNGHSLGKSKFENSKKIIMPINVNNRHWIALMIDRSNFEISIFDSINPHQSVSDYHNTVIEKNIRSFLNCTIPGPQFEPSNYKFIYVDVTQQTDDSSCGPFTILNILDQLNLIQFEIQNTEGFFRDLKLIMFNEFINNDDYNSDNTYQSGFILSMLE